MLHLEEKIIYFLFLAEVAGISLRFLLSSLDGRECWLTYSTFTGKGLTCLEKTFYKHAYLHILFVVWRLTEAGILGSLVTTLPSCRWLTLAGFPLWITKGFWSPLF